MNISRISDVADRADGHRRFVVNLTERGADDIILKSCEVLSHSFRNRVSFSAQMRCSEIFHEQISTAIDECLQGLGEGHQVLSLPSLVVELPGLIMAGAHVIASAEEDGVRAIIVRFRISVGSMAHAFLQDVGFGAGLEETTRELSAQVLSEIAMPLLNVLAASDTGLVDSERAIGVLGQQLSERVHEIRFNIEMVKRFTEQLERDRNGARVGFIEFQSNENLTSN